MVILKFIQADTEVYTGWYWNFYRLILKFIQADTEIFTGWYWSLYRVILTFTQWDTVVDRGDSGVYMGDTEVYTEWHWNLLKISRFVVGSRGDNFRQKSYSHKCVLYT